MREAWEKDEHEQVRDKMMPTQSSSMSWPVGKPFIETTEQVLSMIEKVRLIKTECSWEVLQQELDDCRELIIKGITPNWDFKFGIIGKIIIKLLGPDFDQRLFADMLVRKAADYGARPLLRWGEFGIIVRIDSKNDRLTNIREKFNAQTNGGDLLKETGRAAESYYDTMKDILGYALNGLVLITIPAYRRKV